MKLLLASVASYVLEKALPLFPKNPRECKIVCIATAAKVEKEPKEWLHSELNVFREAGFDLHMLDIDGMTEENVSKALEGADIVYVTGGNTFFLLEKMKACNFEKIIRKTLARDCVYIGSSAGTAICCPDIDYISAMDDPGKAQLNDTLALNLVDFFVMVHMDHPDFGEQANAKVSEMKKQSLPVVCLKDHEALFVDGESISII